MDKKKRTGKERKGRTRKVSSPVLDKRAQQVALRKEIINHRFKEQQTRKKKS